MVVLSSSDSQVFHHVGDTTIRRPGDILPRNNHLMLIESETQCVPLALILTDKYGLYWWRATCALIIVLYLGILCPTSNMALILRVVLYKSFRVSEREVLYEFGDVSFYTRMNLCMWDWYTRGILRSLYCTVDTPIYGACNHLWGAWLP